jgi:hypothetical protein
MGSELVGGERFLRIVGTRQRPPLGVMPSAESRRAMAQMGRYRTRAPKGVFRYLCHEDANADRERWSVDAIVAAQTHD